MGHHSKKEGKSIICGNSYSEDNGSNDGKDGHDKHVDDKNPPNRLDGGQQSSHHHLHIAYTTHASANISEFCSTEIGPT